MSAEPESRREKIKGWLHLGLAVLILGGIVVAVLSFIIQSGKEGLPDRNTEISDTCSRNGFSC